MQTLKWSKDANAMATIKYSSDDVNHVVTLLLIPGNDHRNARRGIIGDQPTNDDRLDLSVFDNALASIHKKKDRIIKVRMLHEHKTFPLYLEFTFEDPDNSGASFELETNSSGVTSLDILVEL